MLPIVGAFNVYVPSIRRAEYPFYRSRNHRPLSLCRFIKEGFQSFDFLLGVVVVM